MYNNKQYLKTLLSTVTSNSCPDKFNFHTHTTFSDGSLSPKDIIIQATQKGLEHLAITDHHSVKAYNIITEARAKWGLSSYNQPILWSGIEISCLLKKCLVHVLGLGFDTNNSSLLPYIQEQSPVGDDLKAENVVKAIHQANGIVILAHPARYRILFSELIAEAALLGFDGVETWYDYNYSSKWKPTAFICDSVYKCVLSFGLLCTCGTDTHGFDIMCR